MPGQNVKCLTTCWQEKLAVIRRPDDSALPPDPEDRVTKTMELTEDLLRRNTVCAKAEDKKVELFPTKGEKISKVGVAISYLAIPTVL